MLILEIQYLGEINKSILWWKFKHPTLIREWHPCIFVSVEIYVKTVTEIILVWNSNRLITVWVHPKSPSVSRAQDRDFQELCMKIKGLKRLFVGHSPPACSAASLYLPRVKDLSCNSPDLPSTWRRKGWHQAGGVGLSQNQHGCMGKQGVCFCSKGESARCPSGFSSNHYLKLLKNFYSCSRFSRYIHNFFSFFSFPLLLRGAYFSFWYSFV